MPRPLSASAMLTARTTTTLRWRRIANRGSPKTMSIPRIRNLLYKDRSDCPTRRRRYCRRPRRERVPYVDGGVSDARQGTPGPPSSDQQSREKRRSCDPHRKKRLPPYADRVEPRVITSPEHCDQNVTCRSSLGQSGHELSTAAIAAGLNSGGYPTPRSKDWQPGTI
jgi:hypothetical protein